MKKIIQPLGAAAVYFCVATVIAQTALLGVLFSKGAVNQKRAWNVLASLYGIDTEAKRRQAERKAELKDADQESYEERGNKRELAGLDLGLREMAIKNERLDLTYIRSQLQEDHNEFKILKEKIDTLLTEKAEAVRNDGVEQTRMLLETLAPKQAREQLVLMLEDGELNSDDKLNSVVAIVKTMSTDKRKKLLAEFKQPGDDDRLRKILEHVREGEPKASELDEAANSKAEFDEAR